MGPDTVLPEAEETLSEEVPEALTEMSSVPINSRNCLCTSVARLGRVDAAGSIGLIETVLTAPSIVTQPLSQTVNQGANVGFTVAAAGTAPLSYQWRRGGGDLSGANIDTLTLNSVQIHQAGDYTVVITNSFGAITSAVAALTVLVPPQITAGPPANVTNTVGDTVQFGVTATGTAPLAKNH